MAGENLDLSSDAPRHRAEPVAKQRRYLGIHFGCCDVYARVYVNRAETAYLGNCPRCGRKLEILIGPGGSDTRFFSVY